MEISSDTIPAWFVGVMLLVTGIMWLLSRRRQVRMDSRIFAFTLFLEGIIYLTVYQYMDVDVEIRGFAARLMTVTLCFSQFLPLVVAYMRSLNRGN